MSKAEPHRCPHCSWHFAKPLPWPGTAGVCPICNWVLPKPPYKPPQPKKKPKAKQPEQRMLTAAEKVAKRRQKAVRRRINRLCRLFERDGDKCWLCGDPLTMETATEDHYIPKSKGGTRKLDNLRLACFPCNNKRGDADPPELAEEATA